MKISNVTLGEVSTRAPKALGMLYDDSMNQKTMTNHPLTDTICDQIQDSVHPCDPDNMRAGADWQLEQVIEWVSKFGWYLFEHPWQKDEFIRELKKAMRPTTTQEDNNG